MLWRGRRESGNVEDRRGAGGFIAGGSIGGIIIAIVVYLLGGNSDALRNNLPLNPQKTQSEAAGNDTLSSYAKVVLADTEDVWSKIFSEQLGSSYEVPKMVLFSNSTQSGCGFASAQTGPFYCPADSKVYLDLNFFDLMQQRFHASGDFAMAYVIAHEVGHHVQNLLGITAKLDNARGNMSESAYNKLSVKLELQADFFAGVWAHHNQSMKNVLQANDIEEALNAANAIGDDKLQQEAQGYVVPDAFTHGSSAQRMKWFKKGFETGDIKQGDTFNTTDL